MQFMSPEHVAAMNEILAGDPGVRTLAAALDREYRLLYELRDGPHGSTEYWSLTLGPQGVRFGLAPVNAPDLTLRAGYYPMVASSRAAREGRAAEADIVTDGDPSVMERVGPVFARAQSVATLDVEFPT